MGVEPATASTAVSGFSWNESRLPGPWATQAATRLSKLSAQLLYAPEGGAAQAGSILAFSQSSQKACRDGFLKAGNSLLKHRDWIVLKPVKPLLVRFQPAPDVFYSFLELRLLFIRELQFRGDRVDVKWDIQVGVGVNVAQLLSA